MQRSSKAVRRWLMTMLLLMAVLLLSLNVLIGCSMLKPAGPQVVMPEARALQIHKGEPASMDGWLLSASALAKLLERAEACK